MDEFMTPMTLQLHHVISFRKLPVIRNSLKQNAEHKVLGRVSVHDIRKPYISLK